MSICAVLCAVLSSVVVIESSVPPYHTPAPAPFRYGSSVHAAPVHQPYQPAPPPVKFDCAHKYAGNHPDPDVQCSNKFFSCVADYFAGPGLARVCPDGLFYNSKVDQCLRREEVPECNPTPYAHPHPHVPVVPKPHPQPTYAPAPVVEEEKKVQTDELELFLNLYNVFSHVCDQGTAAHPDQPCSSQYLVCDHGLISVKDCPFPDFLSFDPVSQRCVEPYYVKECNANAPQPQHPAPAEYKPVAIKNKYGVDCPVVGSVFVANPALACSTVYYACIVGVAYEMHCPSNLYYDTISQQCLEVHVCPACLPTHGHAPNTPAHTHGHGHYVAPGHSYAPAPLTPYVAPVPSHPSPVHTPYVAPHTHHPSTPVHTHVQPVVAPYHPRDIGFVCSGKEDGKYESGKCANNYYVCSHYQLEHKTCPHGLFFSKTADCCEAPSQIPDCPQDQPDMCAHRSDGIFPIGCSSYVLCRNHVAYVQHCPEGDVFHSGLHRCLLKSKCPAPCGTLVEEPKKY